jgi:hypothetical protein
MSWWTTEDDRFHDVLGGGPAAGERAVIEVVGHLADTESGRWPGCGAW